MPRPGHADRSGLDRDARVGKIDNFLPSPLGHAVVFQNDRYVGWRFLPAPRAEDFGVKSKERLRNGGRKRLKSLKTDSATGLLAGGSEGESIRRIYPAEGALGNTQKVAKVA
jgi:hypothetical protein